MMVWSHLSESHSYSRRVCEITYNDEIGWVQDYIIRKSWERYGNTIKTISLREGMVRDMSYKSSLAPER